MGVYRINKTRLAELVDRTIKEVVEADLTGVTTIGTYAFYGCSNLTAIEIPVGVTFIGDSAFYGCSSLTEMIVLSTTPPILSTINSISSATTVIYVPNASLNEYKTATNWSNFADIMVGY